MRKPYLDTAHAIQAEVLKRRRPAGRGRIERILMTEGEGRHMFDIYYGDLYYIISYHIISHIYIYTVYIYILFEVTMVIMVMING